MSPDTRTDLADRLLLVYTGQQRLAKNLLRTVVRRWMARDPARPVAGAVAVFVADDFRTRRRPSNVRL